MPTAGTTAHEQEVGDAEQQDADEQGRRRSRRRRRPRTRWTARRGRPGRACRRALRPRSLASSTCAEMPSSRSCTPLTRRLRVSLLDSLVPSRSSPALRSRRSGWCASPSQSRITAPMLTTRAATIGIQASGEDARRPRRFGRRWRCRGRTAHGVVLEGGCWPTGRDRRPGRSSRSAESPRRHSTSSGSRRCWPSPAATRAQRIGELGGLVDGHDLAAGRVGHGLEGSRACSRGSSGPRTSVGDRTSQRAFTVSSSGGGADRVGAVGEDDERTRCRPGTSAGRGELRRRRRGPSGRRR